MGLTAVQMVAGIINWLEKAPTGGPGCPPAPTEKVIETFRYFLPVIFCAKVATVRTIVEHANAWLLANKRLDRRRDRLGPIIHALLTMACIFSSPTDAPNSENRALFYRPRLLIISLQIIAF